MTTTNEIAVWSWRSDKSKFTNFGDELGPEILRRLGYRTRRVELTDAQIITAGSILQRALRTAKDDLVVWGAGLIRENDALQSRPFQYAAVRGRLTAAALGLGPEVALGDPGILASKLWKRPKIRYGVGVVPHYTDKQSYPWADKVIDVREPVSKVIHDIASCSTIISSSLHGIIIAQSFGIPAMRLYRESVIGGDFKWADYQTALEPDVHTAQTALIESLRLSLETTHNPKRKKSGLLRKRID